MRYAGPAVVALFTAMYAYRQVAVFLLEPERLHCNDFKHIYLGAYLLGESENPYPADEFRRAAADMMAQDLRFRTILPYVYLPFTGQVLSPLTWFSFPRAVWIWFWINHLLLLLGGWLAARAVGLPRRAEILALVLFLLAWNHPLTRTLSAGQLNAMLLFLFALVLWMTPRAPDWSTGAVAAFAALFKLTPAILFFWFLAERRWKTAGWMALFCAVFFAASTAWSGLRIQLDFLPLLGDMGYGRSTWAEYGQQFYRDPYNQSLNAFYHRTLASDPSGFVKPWWDWGWRTANLFTLADTLALMAVTAYLVWPRRRRRRAASEVPVAQPVSAALPLASALRYGLLVTLSLLIPSILWDHYLVVLVVVHLALARWFVERRTGWFTWVVFALAVIGSAAAVPLDAPTFRSGVGLLGMSLKLWTTLTVWFLAAVAMLGLNSETDGGN